MEGNVRRVIQEMNLHLSHQKVTFSEKGSNQKTKLSRSKHACMCTHTHTDRSPTQNRQKSCFQEAVIKSEKVFKVLFQFLNYI